MDPLRELGRTLLFLGGFVVLIGALLFFGGKLPFRLGRLPGDIIHRGEHTTIYFPIVTCLVLSIGLNLLFWLFSRCPRGPSLQHRPSPSKHPLGVRIDSRNPPQSSSS